MSVTTKPRPMATQKGDGGAPAKAARASPRMALPFGGALQTKLMLGPSQDSFERQADTAAAHVVGGRVGAPLLSALPMGGGTAQRTCSACGDKDKNAARIQRKCACGAGHDAPCSCAHKDQEDHPELQIDRAHKHDKDQPDQAIGAVQSVINSGGTPLPGSVRKDMETGFGRPFGHVRIHDTPRAAASAEGIGAHAYTVGNHIAFNRGQFQPETQSGRFLLAHELAHTVQQAGAPPARVRAISQPGDAHETQANRAASAVASGGPMPGLSPGGAAISRYSWGEFIDDASAVGGAVLDAPGDLVDGAVELAGDVADFVSEFWDDAVALARAVGGMVSLDGTTIVIDIPEFDPCPEIDFSLSLSDLGLDPQLYFPIFEAGASIGIVTLLGSIGIEMNIDAGIGINLEDCSFGPAQLRVNPLTGSTAISGMLSATVGQMLRFGADLGLAVDASAIILVPSEPPIPLFVPLLGVSLGGAMELMLQSRGTVSHMFSARTGFLSLSAAHSMVSEVGYGLDFAYGLYGSFRVLGQDLCRLGWPLDQIHEQIAMRLTMDSALDIDPTGISFSMLATGAPLGHNPLDDLSFAFDTSRLEDECLLCDFLIANQLLPRYFGYNWAALEPTLPRFGGPEADIYYRDPSLTSGSLCRGTCGPDCAPDACDTGMTDLVVCENFGDGHVWHTYANYATCGSAQGCRDHDACYDMAHMPIWGFGGVFVAPMQRACDLDSICHNGFQTSARWAMGGGPQPTRLRYAEYAYSTPGCLGPCPTTQATEGEPEIQQTCLDDRELWAGMRRSKHWRRTFLNEQLFQGFVEVPYIVGVNYGVNAMAQLDAGVRAQLGPINLEDACLTYDPVSMTYTGGARLNMFMNASASATITAALEGFLSDFLCLLNWVTLRGTMTAGLSAQLPTNLSAEVDLFCENGQLMVIPSGRLRTCLNVFGEISAGLDVFLLSFNVWNQTWPLIRKQLAEQCWQMEVTFDPFVVGEMPDFQFVNRLGLDLNTLLGQLFDETTMPIEPNAPLVSNPLPGVGLFFPCVDPDDDDDDGPPGPSADCPNRATAADGRRILTPAQLAPDWQPVSNMRIPGTNRNANVATQMTAEFLAHPVPGGSSRTGPVQRGIYRHPGLPTAGCFSPGRKGTQHYIKGHLLNHNIGGPANDRNLFPITAQANADHSNQVENGGTDVVGRVRSGDLMYYKVTVSSPSTPREIVTPAGVHTGFYEVSATFLCEVADYQICTNETLQRNPSTFVPIPSQFIFHPTGGHPFDTIASASRCPS